MRVFVGCLGIMVSVIFTTAVAADSRDTWSRDYDRTGDAFTDPRAAERAERQARETQRRLDELERRQRDAEREAERRRDAARIERDMRRNW